MEKGDIERTLLLTESREMMRVPSGVWTVFAPSGRLSSLLHITSLITIPA